MWERQPFYRRLPSRLLHRRSKTSRGRCLSLLGGFLWIRFHSVRVQWLLPAVGVLHMSRYANDLFNLGFKYSAQVRKTNETNSCVNHDGFIQVYTKTYTCDYCVIIFRFPDVRFTVIGSNTCYWYVQKLLSKSLGLIIY